MKETYYAFLATDHDCNIKYISQGVSEIFAQNTSHNINLNLWVVFPELQNCLFYQYFQKARQDKLSQNFSCYLGSNAEIMQVFIAWKEEGLEIYFQKIQDDLKDILNGSLEQQHSLNHLLEICAVGLWEWDLKTNCVKWSDNLEEIHKLPQGSFGGSFQSFLELVHPEDKLLVQQAISESKERGGSYTVEFRILTPNHEVQWMASQGRTLKDQDGQAHKMLGFAWNITEQKQIEQVKQETFQLMADHAPVLIWVAGLDAKCTFFNKPWLEFRGHTAEQEAGDGWAEGVHPEDRERCLHTYLSHFHKHLPFSMEYRLQRHDGEYRWFLDRGVPYHDAHNNFRGYIGSCIDITEDKLNQELLQKREEELNDFFENAAVGLQWVGLDLKVIKVNQALLDMLGYSKEEYLGRDVSTVYCDPDALQAMVDKLLTKQNLHNYEARMQAKDGSIKYVLISSNGLWENERFIRSRCFIRDITSRKKAEDALKELHAELEKRVSERTAELEQANSSLKAVLQQRQEAENKARQAKEFTENLIESSLDGICAIDLNFKYTVWNSGMESISGMSKAEVIGRHALEVFPFLKESGEDKYWLDAFNGISAVAKDRPYNIPEKGREGFFEAHYSPLKNEGGQISGAIAIVRDTTERKVFEEALKEKEQRFRSYFELPLVGISIATQDKTLIEVNDKMCSMFGYARHELMNKNWQELTHPEDLDADLNSFERVLSGEIDSYSIDKRYIRKDGKIVYASISTSCVRNPEGRIIYFVTLIQDISERKEAEEALRRSEERFRSYFELPLIGIAITSPNTGWIEVNDKLCSMFGYNRSELMKLTWPELTHADDLQKDVEEFNKVLNRESEGYSIEKRFIRKDGSIIYANYSTRCIRTESGDIDYFVALIQDISDRKKAEEELRKLNLELEGRVIERTRQLEEVNLLKDELLIRAQKALLKAEISEQNYRFLAESIPQIVWTATATGYLDYYNQRWFQYTGLSEEQSLAYEGWESVLHPEDAATAKENWYQSIESGKEYHIEYRIRRASDNSYRWHLARALPLKDEEGNIVKWFGTSTDIDDHKKAEEKLRQIEQRFRKLVDANIIGVMIVDLEGNIHEANEAFLKMVGYTKEDLAMGKLKWTSMTPPKFHQIDREKVSTLAKEGILPPFEKEYIRKDGSTVPVLVGGALLERDQSMTVAFVLDISERKELEKRKDEFIGMASHELKTPVTSLKIFTQMLIKVFEKKNDNQSLLYLHKVDDQINKLTKLISDLLDLSKMQVGKLQFEEETFAIDDLVQEVVENSQLSYRNHKIIIQGKTEQSISADRNRVEQVLINLISNAIKYSPDADKVFVKLAKSFTDEIIISVQDFGIGIAKEDQNKIFDRFFRVSDVEQKNMTFPGFGIGLYISSEIIKYHGGKIWVDSAKGQGTTISFSLPLKALYFNSDHRQQIQSQSVFN